MSLLRTVEEAKTRSATKPNEQLENSSSYCPICIIGTRGSFITNFYLSYHIGMVYRNDILVLPSPFASITSRCHLFRIHAIFFNSPHEEDVEVYTNETISTTRTWMTMGKFDLAMLITNRRKRNTISIRFDPAPSLQRPLSSSWGENDNWREHHLQRIPGAYQGEYKRTVKTDNA